eukprot:Skav214456  [mRNA]  locus=scaffold1870:94032:94701:- [translate_table: standard]
MVAASTVKPGRPPPKLRRSTRQMLANSIRYEKKQSQRSVAKQPVPTHSDLTPMTRISTGTRAFKCSLPAILPSGL